jgi:sugar lactone lactonase YvrE
VARDGYGNLFVSDSLNHTIRKITQARVVSTFAGVPGVPGLMDGAGAAARFNVPKGLAVDTSGNVYVADSGNNVIRKITPAGVVSTLAGGFSSPTGVAVDTSRNVYVTNTNDHTVCKITSGGSVSVLAGMSGVTGSLDGTGGTARFNEPLGLVLDGTGNLYVAEFIGSIRKITPVGVVTTLAGTPGGYDVAFDGAGNMYVAGVGIYKLSPSGQVIGYGASLGAMMFPGIALDPASGTCYAVGNDAVWEVPAGSFLAVP